MTTTVRARFYVQSITDHGQPQYKSHEGVKTGEEVKFHAVYSDDKSSPNYSYSEASPNASMSMLISNKDAWGFFKVGHAYDLIISPAKDAGAVTDKGVTQ